MGSHQQGDGRAGHPALVPAPQIPAQLPHYPWTFPAMLLTQNPAVPPCAAAAAVTSAATPKRRRLSCSHLVCAAPEEGQMALK